MLILVVNNDGDFLVLRRKTGKTIVLDEGHDDLVLFIDKGKNVLSIYEKINDVTYKCVRGLF